MADVTAQLLIDLDNSGAFATNLCASTGTFTSGFWKIEDGFRLRGRGRKGELDGGGMASAVCRLDNADGRFTPQNGSSAYQSGGVNQFRPYIGAKVKLIFNSVTYNWITGIISDVKIGQEAQLCEITIRDYTFLLSRTEVRRPLMRDQRTGVIIHRLLDDVEGAEGREAVANPRFEHNLDGYSQQSGALNTRMTTGFDRALIMEGPASMRVDTGATGFPRYTFPSNLAGLKYQVDVYVKPETDDDIGDQVRLVIRDNIANRFTGSFTALANRDIWTRLSGSGTFDAGSTSQMFQIESIAGNILYRVGATHAVPFVNAIARDIDDGQAHLAYFTEYRGKAHEAIERVRRDEQFALFYFDGAGTAVFHDKVHRWTQSHSLSVQSTFDERGILDYSEAADDRIKTVRVDYPIHVDGTGGQVIGATDQVISLSPTLIRAVFLDYDDGMAKDVIVPLANVDYTVNSAGDGTGTDKSGSVTFTFEDLGSAAIGYFTNTSTQTVYLTSFQVRGTAVRLAAHRATATSQAAGGPALAAEHSWSLEYNDSEPYAQSGAEYVSGRYSTQRERLTAAHMAPFPRAATTTDMTPILARAIGDRVRYTQDNLPFSAKLTNDDYYIDSIDLSIPGDHIQATWRLSPVDDDYWVLEEASSALDTNTVLAA